MRYARDLLFATTKRKKKLKSSYTLVERKAGERLVDKLVKDIYEIFFYCEGGRESLSKSLAKDNGQSVADVAGLALSVQETIKSTVDESALLIKESAAEIQKKALDASLMDLKSFLTAEINRHEEHLKAIRSDLDSVLNKPAEALDISKDKSPQVQVSVAAKAFGRTCVEIETQKNERTCEGSKKQQDEPERRKAKQSRPVEKVILFVGDSLFHPLDSARLSVYNLKAIKLAKSGNTVDGACDRAVDFLLQNGKGTVLYQVEGVVLMAGTNKLRNKKVTPKSLFETLCNSIDKTRTVFDGTLFICKILSRLDLAFVDLKIARYKDLISLGLKLSNVLLIETIDRSRELKFFYRDGLHLNKRKGCVALAGIILSSVYSILRPSRKKAARRPKTSSRPPRGHLRWSHGGWPRPRPKSGHKNEQEKQGSGTTSVVQQGSGLGHRDFSFWSGLDSCDDDDWGGEAGDLSPTLE